MRKLFDKSVQESIRAFRIEAEQRDAGFAYRSRLTMERGNTARQERRKFLEATEAVAAPAWLYASWLAVYVSQGGRITHPRNRNLNQPLENNDYDNPFTYWVPRKPFSRIPTGYGATSMKLLVVPSYSGKSDFSPSSGDNRGSWEYGHSTVLRLDIIKSLGRSSLAAYTNDPHDVESYTDVEAIIDNGIDLYELGQHLTNLPAGNPRALLR